MTKYGARLVVPIDLKKKTWEQKYPFHNRWYPDIPAVAEVKEGQLLELKWWYNKKNNNDSADDVKHADPYGIPNGTSEWEKIPKDAARTFQEREWRKL